METKLIFLVIFLIVFCFIIFQCYEFILNYDYIVNFNKRYKNYEYASSPSFNYTDLTIFDPNDNATKTSQKWKCVKNDNVWMAISEKGYVTVDRQIASWGLESECVNYIFDQSILGYINPCLDNSYANSKECQFLNSLKDV